MRYKRGRVGMIAEEFRGKVFRQIAPRLRWYRGKTLIDSFRPMDEVKGVVVGEPPIITFEDGDEVDVAAWIARGRIELGDQRTKPTGPLTDEEAHKAGRRGGAVEPPAEE